ncbi:MAG: squalene synthase HpnC [Melioribacteraceae bacterium]|nr:squalene synthase HpnC [Melioribacteraceae bacterium]
MNINKHSDIILNKAYKEAILFTKSHYENFPVVSLFIPKYLRKHIAVVYQFARQADDIADEGNHKSEFRIENLELYENLLKKCLTGTYENDFLMALNNTVEKFKLSSKHFYDLINAFKQDIVKKRYASFAEMLNYCEHSANPVGRIILELFNIRDKQAMVHSDAICTALQLTNFYQDVSIDFNKGRIYIPADEMESFKVNENVFELKKNNTNFIALLKYQVDRTQKLFDEGKKLLPLLPGNLRRQIKMTILGGEAILRKIEKSNFNILDNRPKLNKFDIIKILIQSIIN